MNYPPDAFQEWFHQNIWPNMGKKGITFRKGPAGRITYVMDDATWSKLRKK